MYLDIVWSYSGLKVYERNLKIYCSLPNVSTLRSSVFRGDCCEEEVPKYDLTKPLMTLSIDKMQFSMTVVYYKMSSCILSMDNVISGFVSV